MPEGGVKKAFEGFLYPSGSFCILRGEAMASEDFRRKLTAIFSADVAGYSRLMGEDEEATIRTINEYVR